MEHDFLIYIKEYHTGTSKAVPSAYLQSRFCISSRIVRKIVNQLRNDGNPICSGEKKVWNDIYQQIRNNYGTDISLSTFLQEFSMVSKDPEPKENDIQCLTIHASKGKEFEACICYWFGRR